MYAKDDPRSALATAAPAPTAKAVTAYARAEYAKFYETAPQEIRDGARTWYARGQNFLVAYTDVDGEVTWERADQPDEYVVLLPEDGLTVELSDPGTSVITDKASVIVMPPGKSSVTARGKGRLVRLFTTQSCDLAALCSNAGAYAQPHPNLPPFQPWPEPPAGWAIRCYPLDVPPVPGRFGTIYRCTTFMVNAFEIKPPRDAKNLSPHFHDDFEQCSLALDGSYIHHIRFPWITDSTQWLPDDHEICAAPSVAIIPPPSLHTSQGIDPAGNRLVDIFSPPRVDFSQKPGWVINEDEYPMG
ncbi:hypothetical protein [Chelatococcus asaccharovorans]|uniref:5-deoxyglucuronate isomerase n=1 Tax=Chelatococcus asaccharovorans TaxID=28210 RepID=A0A2V3UKW8_9HYPH|nr:hypothetical protein [Chelatococcus asaccharovorans]MBS7705513.1 hypothetical protein [Chelatococcus asaccharovorans]PXW60082.1 hypothetical protein C7450_104134 [Chelatococcus asaccharovorans]